MYDKIKCTLNRLSNYLPQLIIIIYAFVGILIIPDYGISMDEPIQREHGIVTFNYVNEAFNLFPSVPKLVDENLHTYEYKYYGVSFQFFSYIIERLLQIDNARNVFLLRHYLTFLTFLLSCYCFYYIIHWHHNNWKLASLGTIFFILSPRIFAQAFYNPKDIIFLSLVIISLYSFLKFYKSKKLGDLILFTFICALAINARIIGAFIPLLSVLIMLGDSLFREQVEFKKIRAIRNCALVPIFTILFLFATWPYLWENPFEGIVLVFNTMKKYPWEGSLLYWGDFVQASDIPWHYTLSWISVTTPILYSVLFIVGTFYISIKYLPKPLSLFQSLSNQIDILSFLYFFLPLCLVIVFNSTLYHGWRHMYFIYPGFLLLAIIGLNLIQEKIGNISNYLTKRIISSTLYVVIGLSLTSSIFFIADNHPNQQVYFNAIAGRHPEKLFDLDYYGLSYKQALDYILQTDSREEIFISTSSTISLINNRMNFPKSEYSRILIVDMDKADYHITNYNWFRRHEQFGDFLKEAYPFNTEEIFAVKVKDYRIISILKLR